MPSEDTTTLSPRLVRLVLLVALAVGLGGLALPPSRSAAPMSVAFHPLSDAQATALRVPVVAPPVVVKPQPVRRTVRATRHVHRAPRWVRPVSAGVVSAYGMRWGRMHKGIDFGSGYGAPIRAVGDGRVIGAGYLASENGYGKIVLVRHAGGVVTAYAHMSRVSVRSGERVKAGEVLGRVGSTGHSTGPHLHFEVRIGGSQVNPVRWLRRHGIRV